MEIKFIKCHGTGNDFILIDEVSNDYCFTENQRQLLALNLCNRKESIGADGILFLLKTKEADAEMRIFNSDGSEAEMCGNGLRCIGRYAMELLKKESIRIKTMKAIYDVNKAEDIYEGIYTVQIFLNSVNMNTSSLPMIYEKEHCIFEIVPEVSNKHQITAVSMTNPHIVTFVNNLDNDIITELGVKVNNLKSVFPEGVNFNFVKEINDNSIYVRTYERGCGITKSCGTGMTASTVTYCIKHPDMYGKDVNIYNDGGMIKINVTKNDTSYINKFTGNASYVYDAVISVDESCCLIEIIEKEDFDHEINNYNNFLKMTKESIS